MAKYSVLVKDARQSIPEASERQIEDYARRTVVDFCKASRVWRERVRIPVDGGSYNTAIRPEGRIDQILVAAYVTDKSRSLLRITAAPEMVVRDLAPGRPRLIIPTIDGFRLSPEPGGASFQNDQNPAIEVQVVAVPRRQSRQFPDFILERWHEGLVAGIVARMAAIPNKPWTDMALSEMNRRQFQQAITNARQSAETENWAIGRSRPARWV